MHNIIYKLINYRMTSLQINTKHNSERPSHIKKKSGPDSSIISSGQMTSATTLGGGHKMVGGVA